jgi:hypothetical protein
MPVGAKKTRQKQEIELRSVAIRTDHALDAMSQPMADILYDKP